MTIISERLGNYFHSHRLLNLITMSRRDSRHRPKYNETRIHNIDQAHTTSNQTNFPDNRISYRNQCKNKVDGYLCRTCLEWACGCNKLTYQLRTWERDFDRRCRRSPVNFHTNLPEIVYRDNAPAIVYSVEGRNVRKGLLSNACACV